MVTSRGSEAQAAQQAVAPDHFGSRSVKARRRGAGRSEMTISRPEDLAQVLGAVRRRRFRFPGSGRTGTPGPGCAPACRWSSDSPPRTDTLPRSPGPGGKKLSGPFGHPGFAAAAVWRTPPAASHTSSRGREQGPGPTARPRRSASGLTAPCIRYTNRPARNHGGSRSAHPISHQRPDHGLGLCPGPRSATA